MKALIYKDLVALKKSLLLLLGITVLVGGYSYYQGQMIVFPFFFVLIPLILLGILFGLDAEAKFDNYIIPSPVSRARVVLSRYVFVWTIAAVGTGIAIISQILPNQAGPRIAWYMILPAAALLNTIIAAVQLPLMYRLGPDKARLVFVILYFIVFAGFSYIGSNKKGLSSLVEFLLNTNTYIIAGGLFAIVILSNLISFILSVKIYKKKEF